MNRRKSNSLAHRIAVLALSMVIASTVVIGVFSYFLYRSDAIKTNAEKARAVAIAVAASIDSAQFRQILDTGVKNAYWEEKKTYIEQVMEESALSYLYLMDIDYSDTVQYFLEGTPTNGDAKDLGERDITAVFADEMFETLRSGSTSVTDVYDSGEYGMAVSGFAPILDENGTVVGVVGADFVVEEVMRSANVFGIKILIIVLAFCVLAVLITQWYVRRFIGAPIRTLTAAADKITLGDIDIDLAAASNDEIGKLTASFSNIVESTKKQIAVLEALAKGNLTADITPRCERDTMSLAIRETMQSLNAMFSEVNRSTTHVSCSAEQIANVALLLAQGATEQASTVDMLENSVANVASKAKENAEMASKAAILAETIRENAEKGSQQMEHMMQSVKEIGEASLSIEKVLKLIDDIASQTNILAINAAVEAAHAGQHGKGFAVVADEVRSLAARSADAAKNTSALIARSMEKAQLGAQIAEETSASLNIIVEEINESTRIMSNIAGFSKEQDHAIEQINCDIIHVAKVVQQNSATAEESAASSQELSRQSEALRNLVAWFSLRDGDEIPHTKR